MQDILTATATVRG